MHERLRTGRRNVLGWDEGDSVARRVLEMATAEGARSLGIETGSLRVGKWADFVSYDLDDPALVGACDASLLSSLMFSSDSRAVRDVLVGGKQVVQDGEHPLAAESRQDYTRLCREIYPDGSGGDDSESDPSEERASRDAETEGQTSAVSQAS
jgi:formimidoylglutamate deiminase